MAQNPRTRLARLTATLTLLMAGAIVIDETVATRSLSTRVFPLLGWSDDDPETAAPAQLADTSPTGSDRDAAQTGGTVKVMSRTNGRLEVELSADPTAVARAAGDEANAEGGTEGAGTGDEAAPQLLVVDLSAGSDNTTDSSAADGSEPGEASTTTPTAAQQADTGDSGDTPSSSSSSSPRTTTTRADGGQTSTTTATTTAGSATSEQATTTGQTTTTRQPTTSPPRSGDRPPLHFYGMEWTADPHPGDLTKVASLGVDTIMVDFDGTDPNRWRAQLDEAARLGFKVVANYWHGQPAWTLNGSSWNIRAESRLFVETVADHPALLAVYLLHEPYWNDGNGISTELQRSLYQQVKAIANLPLYSAFSWSAFEQRKFASGVCDYCDTWFYPSEFDNDYNAAELDRKLETLLNHFNAATANSPDTKLVWVLQAFESSRAGKQMPTYDEMVRMASTAIEYRASSGQRVDAVFWYTWRHGPEYQEVLGDHPELQPVVREIYDRYVR